MSVNRRGFLKSLGVIAVVAPFSKAFGQACEVAPTPEQIEGPFYPVDDQLDEDADLTVIQGHKEVAEGQVVYIKGVVQDIGCKPIPNALVEIWQANRHGRYNHPNDSNTGVPLDPHFQYWGQAVTNEKGEYIFKTIIPGSYPADVNWNRPSHIHYKISALGYKELITQLYFEGDPLNDKDLILKAIPKKLRPSVIMKLGPPEEGMDPLAQLGQFNIVLKKVRA